MKNVFIAGNWKSNKTAAEAKEWLSKCTTTNTSVVLFVPYTLLPIMQGTPFTIGAQDVSPYLDGAYTGEVSARQIKELATWVLIGHSERRKYFGEIDDMLAKKAEQAKASGLKIIFCVPDDATPIPSGVDVVAYEPVWAIGTGKSDTPENANALCANIRAKSQVTTVIYGGSVTSENVASFVGQPAIDGVLLGGASLDPEKFAALIANAQ